MKLQNLYFSVLKTVGGFAAIATLICFSAADISAQGGSGRITPTTRGTTRRTTTTTTRRTTTTNRRAATTTRTTTRRTTTTRNYDYYYNQGLTNIEEKDFAKALTNFAQAIRLNPRSGDAYYARGYTYYELGDYEKSIEDYTKSIQFKPTAPAYNNRGLAYEMNGNYKLAEDDYRTALRIQPGYEIAQANLERLESDNGDGGGGGGNSGGDGAGDSNSNNNTTTTTNTNKDAEYYAELADDYYDKDDFENALINYNKAIQLDSQTAGSYVRRGFIYHYTGEATKAYQDYNTAVRLNPALKNEPYIQCVLYDYSNDDANMGVRVCTKTIDEFPSFSLAFYKRGVAYRELKSYDLALRDFARSIEIRPKFFNSYIYRGMIFLAQEKYSTAVAEQTSAIRIKSDAYLAYYYRGKAYEGMGNYSQAAADYRKALEINPGMEAARNSLDEVLKKQRGTY